MSEQGDIRRMKQLREQRVPKERDLSLGFMDKQFQREVARPFKQLQGLTELWADQVPEELAIHTKLESFSRGVLRVVVDSSGRLYELDRLLREGLLQRLREGHSGSLRQVKLSVGVIGRRNAGDAAD